MTVTTRIYKGGQVYETIRGSDGSVTQRVLDAQGKRIQDQVESNQKSPYTLWDGAGRIKQVGGNAPYRPQQVQANSGLGKGDPVQDNGGLVSATPRAGDTTELQAQIRQQADQLTTVAKALGGQIGEGDPNSPDPNNADLLLARPRYPRDTYYDEASGTLWHWDDDSANAFANSQWVPKQQLWQGFTETPAATVFVDGAVAVNENGVIYTGTIADGWAELSVGPLILSGPDDPNDSNEPWIEGARFYDSTSKRWFNARPSGTSGLLWQPETKLFVTGDVPPNRFYPGDFWGTSSNGLLQFYDGSNLVTQYYCPSCTDPDPDPDPDCGWRCSGQS